MQYNAVLALVALFSAAVIVWPFFLQVKSKAAVRDVGEEVVAVLSQKDLTYVELADLEYDFHMGKISEESYRTLRLNLLQSLAHVQKAESALREHIAEQLENDVRTLLVNEATKR